MSENVNLPKAFKTKSDLKQHAVVHMKEKPFTCQICGAKFTNCGNLRSHQVTHSEDRPFACSVCKMSFKTKRALTVHGAFHCKICNKNFRRREALAQHEREHLEYRHRCQTCQHSFKSMQTLQFHMKSHEAEPAKPYGCTDCDQSFTTWKGLFKHLTNVCQYAAHNPMAERVPVKSDVTSVGSKDLEPVEGNFKPLKSAKTFPVPVSGDLAPVNPSVTSVDGNLSPVCAAPAMSLHEPVTRDFESVIQAAEFMTRKDRLDIADILPQDYELKPVTPDPTTPKEAGSFYSTENVEPYGCRICDSIAGASRKSFRTAHELANHIQIHKTGQPLQDLENAIPTPLSPPPSPIHSEGDGDEQVSDNNSGLDTAGQIASPHDQSNIDRLTTGPSLEGQFACKSCRLTFGHKGLLEEHEEAHHIIVRIKTIPCDICHLHFVTQDALATHQLNHTGSDPTGPGYSEECGVNPMEALELEWGPDQAGSLAENGLKCSQCSKHFGNNVALQEHQETEHGLFQRARNSKDISGPRVKRSQKVKKILQVRCLMCKVVFKDSMTMRDHECTLEDTLGDFHCQTCDKQFGTHVALQEHQETEHSLIQGASNSKDISEPRAKKELRKAKKILKVRCKKCKVVFKDSTAMRDHRCTLGEFHCQPCDRQFGNVFAWNNHQKCHRRNPGKYIGLTCKVCGKGFKTRCEMKRHEIIHTGEKPHECKVCGKLFRLKQSLKVHLRDRCRNAQQKPPATSKIIESKVSSDNRIYNAMEFIPGAIGENFMKEVEKANLGGTGNLEENPNSMLQENPGFNPSESQTIAVAENPKRPIEEKPSLKEQENESHFGLQDRRPIEPESQGLDSPKSHTILDVEDPKLPIPEYLNEQKNWRPIEQESPNPNEPGNPELDFQESVIINVPTSINQIHDEPEDPNLEVSEVSSTKLPENQNLNALKNPYAVEEPMQASEAVQRSTEKVPADESVEVVNTNEPANGEGKVKQSESYGKPMNFPLYFPRAANAHKKKYLPCKRCSNIFKTEESLLKHQLRVHKRF